MLKNKLSLVAILLWIVTVIVIGTMFVKGNTITTNDGRVSVLLEPAEKAFVLAEMRMLLEGVQSITEGLAANDLPAVAAAASHVGMASAADVNPQLMLKLPVGFKTQGMGVHKTFDTFADKAENGATANELLGDLATQLSSCVACHATYRLDAESTGK